MSDETDYRILRDNLDDMLDQLANESDDVKASRIYEELIDRCSGQASATPDEMEALILGYLIRDPAANMDLLDVHDGNMRRAARKVVEFMVWAATNPDPRVRECMTPIQALNICRKAARRWVSR